MLMLDEAPKFLIQLPDIGDPIPVGVKPLCNNLVDVNSLNLRYDPLELEVFAGGQTCCDSSAIGRDTQRKKTAPESCCQAFKWSLLWPPLPKKMARSMTRIASKVDTSDIALRMRKHVRLPRHSPKAIGQRLCSGCLWQNRLATQEFESSPQNWNHSFGLGWLKCESIPKWQRTRADCFSTTGFSAPVDSRAQLTRTHHIIAYDQYIMS